MDKTLPCEGRNSGSTPDETTKSMKSFLCLGTKQRFVSESNQRSDYQFTKTGRELVPRPKRATASFESRGASGRDHHFASLR